MRDEYPVPKSSSATRTPRFRISLNIFFIRTISLIAMLSVTSNAFVRMVSELANAINVRVCVEGVETKRQRDIVKKMGIRMIQGFFYGKPMKIEEYEKKYLI